MTKIELPNLPLSDYRADFEQALSQGPLLLEAEPGAGKSTLAPLWALELAPAGQQVWLVQPRVLAARSLARRLAQLQGETVGQSVGYQVPFDRQESAETRLRVMTPGILLQHLLRDPGLDGVATVMLDEVHERSLDQDTAWAWLQEVALLRDDLQLVLMSATPDPALRQQIAQQIAAPGRCFPVSMDYRVPRKDSRQWRESIDEQLLRALESLPDWREQTALVFLPGWGAIEACARALGRAHPGARVERLHSRVPDAEQNRALDPASGPRLILATNIAETSLTIADVTLVIDSGLVRQPEYEQRTGISRLRDRRISRASAEQRRGRAGRVQEGHCVRLWSAEEALAPAEQPEIRATDYRPLALRLAHWGSPVADLPWLEPPNPLALDQARTQLRAWQLLDEDSRITEAGRQVSALGTHPRLAALLQDQVREQSALTDAVLWLALVLHFDWRAPGEGDDWLGSAGRELGRNRQWQQQRRRWLKVLGVSVRQTGVLEPMRLAWAFRDRIGHRQASGRYRLNSGISVAPEAPLSEDWAVFPQIAARGKGHVGQGWPLELNAAQRRELSESEAQLEHRGKDWRRRVIWRMGGAVSAEDLEPLTAEAVAPALVADIQHHGLDLYPWSQGAQQLLRRARLAAEYQLLNLPDLVEAALLGQLAQWLAPFLGPANRPDALPWEQGLAFYLGYDALQALDRLLPTHLTLPSERRVAIVYPDSGLPEVSGKLQEFFGCRQMALAEGRVPLRLHLTSPNGSPLAITADLASFWQGAYPEVRKQMRGRYPKHPWPEDPLSHAPTRLTKKRLAGG